MCKQCAKLVTLAKGQERRPVVSLSTPLVGGPDVQRRRRQGSVRSAPLLALYRGGAQRPSRSPTSRVQASRRGGWRCPTLPAHARRFGARRTPPYLAVSRGAKRGAANGRGPTRRYPQQLSGVVRAPTPYPPSGSFAGACLLSPHAFEGIVSALIPVLGSVHVG